MYTEPCVTGWNVLKDVAFQSFLHFSSCLSSYLMRWGQVVCVFFFRVEDGSSLRGKTFRHPFPLSLALPQIDSQVMSESTSVGETNCERRGMSHHSFGELYFYYKWAHTPPPLIVQCSYSPVLLFNKHFCRICNTCIYFLGLFVSFPE